MLAEGFSTKRGRRGALVHHDAINHRVRGRRGARLVALTSGGAIPDNSDYRVVLEPSETFIGTVNEDFAVESMAGDIFQLGNASWRILRINSGTVRVEDAQGSRRTSLSGWEKRRDARGLAGRFQLRAESEGKLERGTGATSRRIREAEQDRRLADTAEPGPSRNRQRASLADYFAASYKALGVIPSQEHARDGAVLR